MKLKLFIASLITIAAVATADAASATKPSAPSAPAQIETTDTLTATADTLIIVDADDRVEQFMETDVAQEIIERLNRNNARDDSNELKKILAIIGVFFIPAVVLIVGMILGTRYLNERGTRRASLIELSLRLGNPLPPEFYRDTRKKDLRMTRIRSGLLWIAWGFGFFLFFECVDADAPAALMTVPIFIGISKLLTVLIENRLMKDKENGSEQD